MDYRLACLSADVRDSVQGTTISMRLFYPTLEAGRVEQFGPYALRVAMNAPAAGTDLPLVVLSHGGGGSALTYRDLAAYLACAGFVVALPEHPGNNRADNSLEGTVANLENRPRHLRLAIDAALANPVIGPALGRGKMAVIGHSMGGYTALAAAGGRPAAGPHETGDGQIRLLAIPADERIGALVLFAPACGWFGYEGALADVDIPILVWAAERDALRGRLNVEVVKEGVRDPAKVDFRMLPNAGHHAFQSPFPASMTRPDFPPSQDPEGFDRAAFLPVLCAETLAFLRRVQQ